MPKPVELLVNGDAHRLVYFLGEGCDLQETPYRRVLFAHDLKSGKTFFVEKANLVLEMRPDRDPAVYDVDDSGNVVFAQLDQDAVVACNPPNPACLITQLPNLDQIVLFAVDTQSL
jgi:hypothetical protein